MIKNSKEKLFISQILLVKRHDTINADRPPVSATDAVKPYRELSISYYVYGYIYIYI